MNKSDPRDKKNRRIIEALDNLPIGEPITPTNFFRSIEIHPNTGRDMLDLYEGLKEIPFQLLRNKEQEIKAIIRLEEGENSQKSIRKELTEIKKQIEDLKDVKKK